MSLDALCSTDDWSAYTADPAWLPHAYDMRQDTLVFAYLPREAQRQAVFLDPRHVDRAPKSPPAPVAELAQAEVRAAAGPLHFIFHTAFCCSTLLTRALDVPGVAMGLKEPAVLSTFASQRASGRASPGAIDALELTLDLLSRPLAPGETQIVKPSNVATQIIPHLLHLRPDAKAVVLHSSLDVFLRAVARRGVQGRTFAREAFQLMARTIPLDTGFTSEDLFLHTDLQIAAQTWLMQVAFLDSVAKRFGPGRVRTLNCENFLENKAGTLARLAQFFDLDLDEPACAAIAAGPVFNEHAKEFGRSFDAAAHKAQQQEAAAAHGRELAFAKNWARGLSDRYNTPFSLGDTLLA